MVKGNRTGFRAQSFKLRLDIVEKLDRYSEMTGVTKTFAVEKAIEVFWPRRCLGIRNRSPERARLLEIYRAVPIYFWRVCAGASCGVGCRPVCWPCRYCGFVGGFCAPWPSAL